MRIKQKTIAKQISFDGVGLHSGINCNVILKPAKVNTGIIFSKRINGNYFSMPGDFKNISKSNFCTTIESEDGKFKVFTIEHLLAAIKGNDIDNIEIIVDHHEIPALDGSAFEFDRIIKNAQVVSQGEYKKFLAIKKNITIQKGDSKIELSPSDQFSIDCIIDFPDPIGIQNVKLGNSIEKIYNKVLSSRTFCFYEDIENMKKNGLAKGGTLKNAIVIKDKKVLNQKGLKSRDEFVKHKVLDMLGDFALINYNFKFKIKAVCPGHEINKLAMQEIFSDFSNYNIMQYFNKSDIFSQEKLLTVYN